MIYIIIIETYVVIYILPKTYILLLTCRWRVRYYYQNAVCLAILSAKKMKVGENTFVKRYSTEVTMYGVPWFVDDRVRQFHPKKKNPISVLLVAYIETSIPSYIDAD